MSWESWNRVAKKGPMAIIWRVVALVVVLSVVIGVTGFVLNPFRQARRIIDKTFDADNVIHNYEWFKQRWQDVQAIDAKVTSSQAAVSQFKAEAGPRGSWKRDDRMESSRLSAVLLGLQQQRADMAAEYNARSKMANRAIFKGGDVELPASIPIQ